MKSSKNIEEFLRGKGEELAVPERLEPEQMHKVLKAYEEDRQEKKRFRAKRLYPVLAAAVCLCLTAGGLIRLRQTALFSADENPVQSETDEMVTAQDRTAAELPKEEQELPGLSAGSYEEIYACLSQNWQTYGDAVSDLVKEEMVLSTGVVELETSDLADAQRKLQTSEDAYGRTNTRTEQVDEADRIKNDGRYLYQIAEKQPEDEDGPARVGIQILDTEGGLAECAFLDGFEGLEEFYIWGDLLITIENKSYDHAVASAVSRKGTSVEDMAICGNLLREQGYHEIGIYGIADRKQPRKRKTFTLQGAYESSRISDGYFYGISRFAAGPGAGEQDYDAYIPSPDGRRMEAEQIYCPKDAKGTSYLVLVSIDLSDPYAFTDSRAVLAGSGTYYVSARNLYVACYQSAYETEPKKEGRVQDTTRLLRFSYGKGRFYAQAEGEVPGNVKNSFSMDESGGSLRIAVTVQEYEVKEIQDDRTGERLGYDYEEMKESSGVYILTSALTVKGKLEGLAKGETIRSVRFLGETCYLVTFQQTDPLFAVDLSDEEHPEVLGELKVSGFSEYLHFYGEDLLLGIGMEADEETGQEQGMKLSMFDISDPAELKEVSRYRLEDYDYSEALRDHRAVLLDTEENIIGFGAEDWQKNTHQEDYFLFSYEEGSFVQNLKVSITIQDQGSCAVRGTFIGDIFYLLFGNGTARAFDRGTGTLLSEI